MNIKIHTVIRDIMGKTGTDILEAIISGEKDPKSFLPFIDPRIRADSQIILKSLGGNWRDEHLFLLERCYACFKFYRDTIQTCHREIESVLDRFQTEYLVASENPVKK